MSKDKDFEHQSIKKTRITFSSSKLDAIQKVTNSLVGNAKNGDIKIKGPVMLPNKHLRICSRRTPCGEGSKTWDNWEMTVHKRYIDVEYTDVQSMK
jgi:small subunit ribosomal protein S20e